MASRWYPVVDILSCIECGTCVNNCPHDVYDKSKTPVPHVTAPQPVWIIAINAATNVRSEQSPM